jgi:hypothetical protein
MKDSMSNSDKKVTTFEKKNERKRVRIPLDEWYNFFALEVELVGDDAFLKVKETLTRVGVSSNKNKKLFQSCHILSKKDKYYIVHFKELFALDGRAVDISEEDIQRRNAIACLLDEWGMIKIIDRKVFDNRLPVNAIKVLKYSEKDDYELIAKYKIGHIKRR